MQKKIPKIGILINNIEGRYQNLILSGLKHYSFDHPCNFYYFVGKSLLSPYKDEESYNSVYQLAKEEQIDGLIVATGSIGNYQNDAEIKEFLQSFFPKPIISIGTVVNSIPSIYSDGSLGLKELIKHFVSDHQFQRIAYISGPDSNSESSSRLKTFLDEMTRLERPIYEELVLKGDFSFNSGQILTEKLISGKSLKCDAIICANDEMALGVMAKLEEWNFFASKDYAIAGFDNISDAHFTSPPLTTINQFLPGQAYLACQGIEKIINKNSIPLVMEKPSKLILRESCGCGRVEPVKRPGFFNAEEKKPLSSLNLREVIDSIIANSPIPQHLISEIRNAVSALLETLILDLRLNRNKPIFLQALNDWLSLTLDWENYTELWHRILQNCHNELLALSENDIDLNYIHILFQQAYAAIALRTAQKELQKTSRLKWLIITFNSISARLNFHSDFHKALENVSCYFHSIGIEDFHIILEEKKEELFFSTYKPNQKEGKSDTPLPLNLLFSNHHKMNVFLPLTFQEQCFGYICLSGKEIEPLVCNMLRSAISQTLFSLKLLQKNRDRDLQLKKAMETLQQSEARYKKMASVNPMFIIETTPQLKISYLNHLSENFFNKENPPINLNEILLDEDKEDIKKIVHRLKLSEEIPPYPGIRIIGGNRQLIPVAQISPIYNEDSRELTGLRFFAFDPIPFIRKSILPSEEFFHARKISPREQDVIKLVLQGMSIKNIGENLFISESTVKGHLTQIYSKFGVSGKNEMTLVIQNHQVKTHGYSEYLFTVLNHLLTIEDGTKSTASKMEEEF